MKSIWRPGLILPSTIGALSTGSDIRLRGSETEMRDEFRAGPLTSPLARLSFRFLTMIDRLAIDERHVH